LAAAVSSSAAAAATTATFTPGSAHLSAFTPGSTGPVHSVEVFACESSGRPSATAGALSTSISATEGTCPTTAALPGPVDQIVGGISPRPCRQAGSATAPSGDHKHVIGVNNRRTTTAAGVIISSAASAHSDGERGSVLDRYIGLHQSTAATGFPARATTTTGGFHFDLSHTCGHRPLVHSIRLSRIEVEADALVVRERRGGGDHQRA